VVTTPGVTRKSWVAAVALALLATVLAPTVSAQVREHFPPEAPSGYLVAGASGGEVHNFGAAQYVGSAADDPVDFNSVGIAATPTGEGYWLVSAEGQVRAYGDAVFRGDASGLTLNAPIVAIEPTGSGNGYWLVASDGGVFTFGDAGYFGSVSHLPLAEPVVSLASTADDTGYWLAASDGGVFALGSADFHGSAGAIPLNQPIVDMVESITGDGYWLIAQDGGAFSYADVDFHGSLGNSDLHGEHIVDAEMSHDGDGYWMVGHLGSVFAFGSANYLGGASAGPEEPIGAMTARPQGDGYWLATAPGHDWLGPPIPANSGTGRRIVYSNSQQRVWLIEDDGSVFDSYLVSGKYLTPGAGEYKVFSKSRYAFAAHDGITMDHMVRFAHGRRLAIGFHSIPKYANGVPMQTEEELGTYQSGGCVRQRNDKAEQLFNWAPVGTKVVVLN